MAKAADLEHFELSLGGLAEFVYYWQSGGFLEILHS